MTSWSPLTDLPDHVRDRAARVRLVCFDVDGVMTDGQGFAAFGQVTSGLDVARKIQAAPASGQTLTPPIGIRRAYRLP